MSYISNKIIIPESYTFDDVLLLPNYSDFYRSEIQLTVDLCPTIRLYLPVVSSPMDTVTNGNAAAVMAQNGGLGIIHRAFTVDEQAAEVAFVKNSEIGDGFEEQNRKPAVDKNGRLLVGAAVGVDASFEGRLEKLVAAGVDIVVLDTAHGHAQYIIDGVKKIKTLYPQLPVIAGNITTSEAAEDLIAAGANVLRVGMGPGSICTTRIVTGMGVPQLTAVDLVANVAKKHGVAIIADGGIKQIGDVAKALGFGADCVMLGSMLAGFEQSPGKLIELDGQLFRTYRGMGSVGAMTKNGGGRYGQETKESKKLVAEGVEGLVKLKGDLNDFLFQIGGGLLSSFYYIGAKNSQEFYEKARFVKISSASLKESHPHTISVVNGGASYQ